MYTYIDNHMHTYVHTYEQKNKQYIHYIHTHTHIYTYIHTHIYVHTYIPIVNIYTYSTNILPTPRGAALSYSSTTTACTGFSPPL